MLFLFFFLYLLSKWSTPAAFISETDVIAKWTFFSSKALRKCIFQQTVANFLNFSTWWNKFKELLHFQDITCSFCLKDRHKTHETFTFISCKWNPSEMSELSSIKGEGKNSNSSRLQRMLNRLERAATSFTLLVMFCSVLSCDNKIFCSVNHSRKAEISSISSEVIDIYKLPPNEV